MVKKMKKMLKPLYNIKKWLVIKPLYDYNCKRFVKYSSRGDSEESLIGNLTMAAHAIEKGLTMGNFRPAFGREKLLILLNGGLVYIKKYGKNNVQIQHIAKVVIDYKICHEKINYQLDGELLEKINGFLSHFDCPSDSEIQINYTKESFFSKRNCDFFEFSNSRHSCRDYDSTPVPMETIDKAVRLAQNAPSACNRQPARIYVIESKDKMKKILNLHGGNRGFGEKIDKLIMICGYIPCYHTTERDCVYTDCGIFAMNLAYALHYYEVGACILNWSMTPEKDKAARNIIPVPDEEVICSLISCGNVPKKFKVCNSGKKDLNSIIHHI